MALPLELVAATTAQLPDTATLLVVPVGATEQHGPHLPLDTDTRIATAVARAVTTGLAPGAVLAPALSYGASGEHQDFPGTVSLGTAALTTLLVELGRSACTWVARVLLVNGHGGNVAALRAAVQLLRYEGRDVAWCSCAVPGADAHAGHTETSLLLHLCPADVRVSAAQRGNCAPLAELLAPMRAGGVAAVSKNGVLGDPTGATAVAGKQFFEHLVAGATDSARRWTPRADGMLV